jgi:hypothetical protein
MAGSFGSIFAKKFLSAVSLSWTLEEASAVIFAAAFGCETKQIPFCCKANWPQRDHIAPRTSWPQDRMLWTLKALSESVIVLLGGILMTNLGKMVQSWICLREAVKGPLRPALPASTPRRKS